MTHGSKVHKVEAMETITKWRPKASHSQGKTFCTSFSQRSSGASSDFVASSASFALPACSDRGRCAATSFAGAKAGQLPVVFGWRGFVELGHVALCSLHNGDRRDDAASIESGASCIRIKEPGQKAGKWLSCLGQHNSGLQPQQVWCSFLIGAAKGPSRCRSGGRARLQATQV